MYIKRRNAYFLIFKLISLAYEHQKRHFSCPKCGSKKTVKNGIARGIQTYLCRGCNLRFSGSRRPLKDNYKQLWKEYVFDKQTVIQLARKNRTAKRKIQSSLNKYSPLTKCHKPRPVHLVVDGTYFGERKEGTSWCVVVARDPKLHEDLVWSFENTETTYAYVCLMERLEALGYTILSVTGDGFSGIKSAFSDISYQMCHVHMERLVILGTTRNPLTEAGQVLLALVRTLHKNTEQKTFEERLNKFIEKYRNFLNEKTTHPESGEQSWTHEDLRRAVFCLVRHKSNLFTYKQNRNIPRTTNSLEGHFKHIKKLLGLHSGSNRKTQEKIIETILLASTTSPNKKRLNEVI